MRSYEIAIKTVKREYFAASIVSASSHPAQLFKIIQSLTTLESDHSNTTSALNCEDFANYFENKILTLRQDLPPTTETLKELEASYSTPKSTLDNFERLNLPEITKVLASVRPTTCPLDPCPSWLIKSEEVSTQT